MSAVTDIIKLGVTKVWPVKIAAPFVVPFLDDDERLNHPVYGVSDATDLSYWNVAFRNAGHNQFVRKSVPYRQRGNTTDWTLEKEKGFQWRIRESLSGDFKSFRMTWGKPRASKGKREVYMGWTMDQKRKEMRLTFFQFRLF